MTLSQEEIEEYVFQLLVATEKIKWWEEEYRILHGDGSLSSGSILASVSINPYLSESAVMAASGAEN